MDDKMMAKECVRKSIKKRLLLLENIPGASKIAFFTVLSVYYYSVYIIVVKYRFWRDPSAGDQSLVFVRSYII